MAKKTKIEESTEYENCLDVKEFEDGTLSSFLGEEAVKDIEEKIQNAAYSLKTFGTMNKQGAFINGAKWAIHNLTDAEIKHMRENSDPEDHSFFGL